MSLEWSIWPPTVYLLVIQSTVSVATENCTRMGVDVEGLATRCSSGPSLLGSAQELSDQFKLPASLRIGERYSRSPTSRMSHGGVEGVALRSLDSAPGYSPFTARTW